MKIRKLKLYTDSLNLEKKFYSETLGFKIINEDSFSFTLEIGWSELTFAKSEKNYKYHYCFLIPSNKLKQALLWMEKRVAIIDIENGRKIEHFESWNAESFYFYDASGNIAEFIVRYDLNNNTDNDFSISDVICLNEFGMPTSDVKSANDKLQEKFGTKFWKGNFNRFGTNGSQEGLFLLPNYKAKKIWFPTSVKIKPQPFEIQFENNGETYNIEHKK